MWRRSGDRLAYPLAGYLALDPALRLRFLLRGLTELGADHRVPFPFLSRIISLEAELASGGPGRFAISGSGFEFRVERDTVFWGPDIVQKPKTGYLVYVSAPGTYTLAPGLTVTLSGSGGAVSIDRLAAAFTLPVTIRTRAGGDSLPSADGKRKTLKKLMNEWSVSEGDRDRLPLIECSGTLRAVYGSLLGYPDWIVHT
jgi:tRNA(Ile)-lysidine synthetase-like protein